MMFLISCANIRIIFRIVNLWLAWRDVFLAFLCVFVRFVAIQLLAAGQHQPAIYYYSTDRTDCTDLFATCFSTTELTEVTDFYLSPRPPPSTAFVYNAGPTL